MIVIQVKQQLVDTEQDYERLRNTPFVTSLGITLGDLKWAADMATSRSFAIPKGLGGDCISSLSAVLRPHNKHGLHDVDCSTCNSMRVLCSSIVPLLIEMQWSELVFCTLAVSQSCPVPYSLSCQYATAGSY